MGWQVALILDTKSDPGAWIGRMPVWAVTTVARRDSAAGLRADWESLWAPEHALTLLSSSAYDDPAETLLALVPTLEGHHPFMTCVRVLGIADSDSERRAMASMGYKSISRNSGSSIGFAKPISELSDVPEFALDAAAWQTRDDVFDSFFRAVDAPPWHGRNFNALNDSIGTGNINKTEVPYRIIICNAASMSDVAALFVRDFEDLVRDLQAGGCPVEMQVRQ
jgi:Barstar (barnase inhibitor)